MSEKAQKRKGRVRLERKSEKANVKLQRADLAAARAAASLDSDDDDAMPSSKRGRTDSADSRFASEADAFKVRNRKELMAAPTQDELRELEHTEHLFKSNLFKMQMDEMLKEIRVSKAKQSGLEYALHELKASLDGMADASETDMDTNHNFGGVRAPVGSLGTNKIAFTFLKPASVSVVGSYLLDTATKPQLNVDLAVEMPAEMFQAKDHMNHRYTLKRAFYLATLASILRKNGLFADMWYTHAQGNTQRPILAIRPSMPSDQRSTKFVIRIFPTVTSDWFKLSKLQPDRNNFRSKVGAALLPEFFADKASSAECATPYYNAAILGDMYMGMHLELINQHSGNTNFVDAVRLLKTWVYQREMSGDTLGAFNGFCATMLLVHLLESRAVFKDSSSFQMFRAVLVCIAESRWDSKGLVMAWDKSVTSGPDLAAYAAAFDVVFVGPSGQLNLLAQMTKGQYQLLKREAAIGVDMLGDSVQDGFDGLFMKKVDFDGSFDLVFQCTEVSEDVIRSYFAHFLSRGGDWQAFAIKFLPEVLRRGLKDRATMIVSQPRKSAVWKVTSPSGGQGDGFAVRIGICLAPEHVGRTIDMGPPADHEAEANSFRSFWGPKSELRRFPSGAIAEAVVWSSADAAGPLALTQQIVRYVLQRHARLKTATVRSTAEFLTEPMRRPAERGPNDSERMANEMQSLLGTMLKQLRDCRDSFPLGISSLQGIGPGFRSTAPVPDDAGAGTEGAWPSPLVGHDCVLQFESSTQWPEDVSAIQKVKAAFYIKLATALAEKHEYETSPTEHHVDVLVKPHVFRIVIHVPQELTLARKTRDNLARAVKSSKGAGTVDAGMAGTLAAYGAAVAEMERFFVQMPRHTKFVQALQQSHRSFGGAVRLAKRWVSAHMLSGELGEEAVETVVGSLYTNSQPHDPPGSALVGFLRFLRRLGTFDWARAPLILNVDGELTTAQHTAMVDRFASFRSELPAMTLLSPFDAEMSLWTKLGPSKSIVGRLVRLARASSAVLERSVSALGDEDAEDARMMFKTPLADYDALLLLRPDAVPARWKGINYEAAAERPGGHQKFKNLAPATGASDTLRVNFDPAQLLLGDLRKAFGHVAKFYYDGLGGTTIGVVWDSAATTAHPFKVRYTRDAVITSDAGGQAVPQIQLNVAAVLEDFKLIGKGMIRTVQLRDA